MYWHYLLCIFLLFVATTAIRVHNGGPIVEQIAASHNAKYVVLYGSIDDVYNIFLSDNYGLTFNNSRFRPKNPITSIAMSTDGHYVGMVELSSNETWWAYHYSTNYGATFTRSFKVSTTPAKDQYYYVFMSPTAEHIFLMKENSVVYNSSDYGMTFYRAKKAAASTPFLTQARAADVFAVLIGKQIHRSIDFGGTWIKSTVSAISPTRGYHTMTGEFACKCAPNFAYSSDWFVTWGESDFQCSQSALTFDGSIAYASSASSQTIYRININSGEFKKVVSIPFSDDYVHKNFIIADDGKHIFAPMFAGGILRSQDGGETWKYACAGQCKYPNYPVYSERCAYTCSGIQLNNNEKVVFKYIFCALYFLQFVTILYNIHAKSIMELITVLFVAFVTSIFAVIDVTVIVLSPFCSNWVFSLYLMISMSPLIELLIHSYKQRNYLAFRALHIPDWIWNMFDEIDNAAKGFAIIVLCIPFFIPNSFWVVPLCLSGYWLMSTHLYCFFDLSDWWDRKWTLKKHSDLIALNQKRFVANIRLFNRSMAYRGFYKGIPTILLLSANARVNSGLSGSGELSTTTITTTSGVGSGVCMYISIGLAFSAMVISIYYHLYAYFAQCSVEDVPFLFVMFEKWKKRPKNSTNKSNDYQTIGNGETAVEMVSTNMDAHITVHDDSLEAEFVRLRTHIFKKESNIEQRLIRMEDMLKQWRSTSAAL